jgi:hypothetical protein
MGSIYKAGTYTATIIFATAELKTNLEWQMLFETAN